LKKNRPNISRLATLLAESLQDGGPVTWISKQVFLQEASEVRRYLGELIPQLIDVRRERTPTNVCGHPYRLQIRSYVPESGNRSPASISRYSRTLTPTNQAA